MARAEQIAELLRAIVLAHAEASVALARYREEVHSGRVARNDAEALAAFEQTYGSWRDACRDAVNNAGAFLAGPCPKNPVNLSEGVLRAINSVFALSVIAADDHEAAVASPALNAVLALGLAEHWRTRGAAPVPYFDAVPVDAVDTTADIADTTADNERPGRALAILDAIVEAWNQANALCPMLENPQAEEFDNVENALRYWNDASHEQLREARRFLTHCDKADNKAGNKTGNKASHEPGDETGNKIVDKAGNEANNKAGNETGNKAGDGAGDNRDNRDKIGDKVGNNANPVVKLILRALVAVDDVCNAAGDGECLAGGACTLNSVTEFAAAVLTRRF